MDGDSDDALDLTGIVFDNYNTGSTFMGEFANRYDYPDAAQTYDYLEPITLMAQGADQTLTFALKTNNDGYHGAYYNSNSLNEGPYHLDTSGNAQTGEGVIETHYQTKVGEPYEFYDTSRKTALGLEEVYTFEYLTNKNGNRMNLYGSEVTASAGYYIICVGDADYKYHSTPYDNNAAFDGAGQYSVEWYVYDADGKFLLHTISDSLYAKDHGESYISYQLLSKNLTDSDTLSDRAVKICYEAPNTRGTTTRFSGQWFTTSTRTRVTVYAGVGMMTDDGKPIVPENPNSDMSYGTATVSIDGASNAETGTTNKLNWGNLFVSDSKNGCITLTATTKNDSTFKGWYSYNEKTDAYDLVNSSPTYSPKPDADTRYFAMFAAQATYNFTYTGRTGPVTYSMKSAIGASEDEMTGGGILSAETKGTEAAGDYNGQTRAQEIQDAITALSSVLRVFNRDISFSRTVGDWNFGKVYEVTVDGSSPDSTHHLSVYWYDENGELTSSASTITGGFNKTIDLTDTDEIGTAGVPLTKYHPADAPVFVGWYQYNASVAGDAKYVQLLSTRANFGFSLTGDLTIAPKFVASSEAKAALLDRNWHAYIDRHEITAEKTDSGTGKIFNDNLIRFRFGEDSSQQVPSGDISKCGIVILAQTATSAASASSKVASLTDADVQTYVRTLVNNDIRTIKMNSKYGEAYAFSIPAESLSRLNRIDIYQILDYAKFKGGNYQVMAYYQTEEGDNDDGYVFSNAVHGDYTP